jgi:bromodomain-containing factor 1
MSNEDNGVPPPPPTEPSALKSLLNPVTEGVTGTPSSTVPEPPKSPQPIPETVTTESAPAPAAVVENQPLPPTNGDSLPPLPTDAPVPRSPKAADEPPPVLPEGAIPPAVSTPSVITDGLATPALETEAPAAQEVAPTVELTAAPPSAPAPASEATAPAPPTESTPVPPSEPAPPPPPQAALLETAPAPTETPAPAGIIEPTPTPAEPTAAPALAPTSQLPTVPASDAMDVDQPEPSPAASLKRSGDELEGREEKRTRDDEIVAEAPSAPPAQVTAPAPAPAAPASEAQAPAPPGNILVPGVGVVPGVIPPPPVASGPTTPLTLTQHKHVLSCIRSLKKNKDAGLFLEPVDPVRFGIPHYPTIITNPMDLSTVETKLIVSDPRGPPKDKSKMKNWDQSKGKYNSVADVSLDVRQIFWNTARFNGMEHLVTQAATRLDAVFTKMINNIPPEVS